MAALEMNTGIYAIEHISSGKCYIGSAVNFPARWRAHLCHLRKGTHHSPHLQSAWAKYGPDEFKFKKLIVCSKENLLFYEQSLVDGFKSANREFGFNARPLVSSSLGMKLSDSAREKIKAARSKQVFSDETRALWSKNRKGRKMPEWFGEFSRTHKTGTTHTPETKALISAAQRGKPQKLQRIEARTGTTLERAKEILAEYQRGGISQTALAKKYGIHQSTISLMASGKRWSRFLTSQEK